MQIVGAPKKHRLSMTSTKAFVFGKQRRVWVDAKGRRHVKMKRPDGTFGFRLVPRAHDIDATAPKRMRATKSQRGRGTGDSDDIEPSIYLDLEECKAACGECTQQPGLASQTVKKYKCKEQKQPATTPPPPQEVKAGDGCGQGFRNFTNKFQSKCCPSGTIELDDVGRCVQDI